MVACFCFVAPKSPLVLGRLSTIKVQLELEFVSIAFLFNVRTTTKTGSVKEGEPQCKIIILNLLYNFLEYFIFLSFFVLISALQIGRSLKILFKS